MAELKRKKGDNGKYGFVDENGNWVVEPKYKGTWDSREGFAAFMNDDDLCGYVDTEGKVVIEPEYYAVTNFFDGYAIASIDDGVGVILDKKGNTCSESGDPCSDTEINCIDIGEMNPEEKLSSTFCLWDYSGGGHEFSMEKKGWLRIIDDWDPDED